MKVLLLTVHYKPNVGGVETHLNDLTESLVRLKHNVFVLTYRPLSTSVSWKMHEKSNQLEIYRIPWIPGLFYKFISHPVLTFIYLLPGLFIYLPFVLIIKKPEVIHAHGLVAGFAGVFWGKLFGIRTVVSTHSLYEFPESGLYRRLVVWIFNRADHVSTLSKQALKEIRSLDIEINKTSTFTYWVDQKVFKPVKEAKKKLKWGNAFTVLFVGRLVEEKGILVLLESFKSWDKKIRLAVAGNGPLEVAVKNLANNHPNLIYLGRIDQNNLPMYYSAADVLIVPSTHEEGFGRVIVESLSCGTPVIGSNRGAIPEAMDSSVGSLIKITPSNLTKTVFSYFNDQNILLVKKSKTRILALDRYSNKDIQMILNTYSK